MNSTDLLTAEIFERTIRLYGLVQKSTRSLVATGRGISAQIVSADRIMDLLKKLVIDELASIYGSSESDDAKVDQLRALMEVLAIVHEGTLPTVPRVIEPIELHSYIRQGNQSHNGEPPTRSKTLVFAAERLGMQVYPNSLAGLLKQLAVRHKLQARARHYPEDIAKLALATLAERIDPYQKVSDSTEEAYVAIPAIDIHNPTRWPSLWHELGHHKLQQATKSLIQRFEDHLTGSSSNKQFFDSLCVEAYRIAIDREDRRRVLAGDDERLARDDGQRLIAEWLRECWCDAHGVRQAGLGFLYSQLHDFMFSWPSYLSKNFVPGQPYPPAWFRLRLSRSLAIERLRHQRNIPDQTLVRTLVDAYSDEEKAFLALTPDKEDVVRFNSRFANLYTYFLSFLKADIDFSSRDVLAGDISGTAFKGLEDDLKLGLPIPSILDERTNTPRAAQVSEIILAGWRTRNDRLRNRLLEEFSEFCRESTNMGDCIQHSVDLIDRADDSMKRSIQVAEWFSILSDAGVNDVITRKLGEEQESNESENEYSNAPGLLSDAEINRLLFPMNSRPELRIIPLINIRQQIKGTSIDLRLGHNFEIFQSIGQLAVDACNSKSDDRFDSIVSEIDFLEGIPILPGQFILGHTLEYIKLPRHVAAQIEGRSSFARLGIQVHMTANLVEAGFEGCLTLEIRNSGPSTVVLYPGMRFAQIRLFRISGYTNTEYSRPGNKYHGQLGQNRTKQFADHEVGIFRKQRALRGQR